MAKAKIPLAWMKVVRFSAQHFDNTSLFKIKKSPYVQDPASSFLDLVQPLFHSLIDFALAID